MRKRKASKVRYISTGSGRLGFRSPKEGGNLLLNIAQTKYAKSDDVHVAYQTFGQGPIQLVFGPGWASHIEYAWEEPSYAKLLQRLGSFASVAWFDKRGTGLSDA